MKSTCLLLAVSVLLSATVCVPAVSAKRSAKTAKQESQKGEPAKKESDKKDPNAAMRGYVSNTASRDEIAGCIDEALATAITRSAEAQKNEQKASKYAKTAQRAWKATKSTVNFMLDDRGFLPSIEGGQLMLDENIKAHDKASAECAKQMWLDKTHDKVVADIVEMVTGLGATDAAKHQQLVGDAMQSLISYDGEPVARHVYDRLAAWSDSQQRLYSPWPYPTNMAEWSVKERQSKVDMIVSTVDKNDPIVEEVTKRVHKYSKHSKVAVGTSQVVSTVCNVASLTPTLIGPAAQGALLIFSLGTGGFEEDKLLSEMYLGKRYQSRQGSIKNQALMALDAYQLAMETHNAALGSCSASLVRRLGGENLWRAVCLNTPMPETTAPIPPSPVSAQLPPTTSPVPVSTEPPAPPAPVSTEPAAPLNTELRGPHTISQTTSSPAAAAESQLEPLPPDAGTDASQETVPLRVTPLPYQAPKSGNAPSGKADF
jgi:hypothetical protein